MAKILISNQIKPDALGGLSLGEYACFAIANVFSIEELERILIFRQMIMDDALKNSSTGMIACLGLPTKEIEKIASNYDLVVTNYNSPLQTVLGGKISKINKFKDAYLRLENTSVIDLPVVGAFHSPYLNSASEKLRRYLSSFGERAPTVPIYCNLTGEKSIHGVRDMMVKHLVSPVQFQSMIENMINDGIEEFISIGIGTTPVNLIRQTCKVNGKRAKVRKVESLEDIEGILA